MRFFFPSNTVKEHEQQHEGPYSQDDGEDVSPTCSFSMQGPVRTCPASFRVCEEAVGRSCNSFLTSLFVLNSVLLLFDSLFC